MKIPFFSNKEKDSNIILLDKSIIKESLSDLINDEKELENITEKIANEIKDYIEAKEKTTLDLNELPFIVQREIKSLIFRKPIDRLKLCKEVDLLLDNYPEAKQSVKIYASTITYGSPEFKLDEYKFIITKKDDSIDDDQVDGAKKFLIRFEKESKIKRLIYQLATDLVKYEDAFLEKIFNNNKLISVAYIPSNTVYMVIDEYGKLKNIYQILDTNINYSDIINLKYDKTKVIKFEENEFIHINDGSFIGLGDSPLISLIPLWRAYQLLQQSLILHRVTRSKRYTVFFVDVSGKEKKEIRDTIRAFVNKLRSFFTIDLSEGIEYGLKSSVRAGEDLVIPITKESATKMQIIPPDSGAHRIDDLEFFHDRLLNILFTEHLFGRNKKGKSPDVEKAFNRLIRVYQRNLAWALEDIYNQLLIENGFEGLNVSIVFPSPDSEEEIKLVDTLVRRLLLINQLTTVLGKTLPFDWVLEYVFKDLTLEQIEELKEKLIKKEEQPSGEKELVEQLVSLSPQKENLEIPESEGISEEEINKNQQFREIFEKSREILDLSIRYLELKGRNIENVSK